MADEIVRQADAVRAENQGARASASAGLAPALIDRLAVTDSTIAAMACGLREVAKAALTPWAASAQLVC